MYAWSVRRAEKTNLKLGSWSSVTIPKSAFPLSKARTKFYRLGRSYTWRVITFEIDEDEYRLLLAYRVDKEQYFAMLGMDSFGDTKIVARLEFHGTHGGWHIHYPAIDLSSVPPGIRSHRWLRRRECEGQDMFLLSGLSQDAEKSTAMTIASRAFGLQPQGGLL